MLNEFMSLEMIGSFAGLVLAVTLVVQFTKSIVKQQFGDSFVRLYAFVVSLLLTFLFARISGGVEGIALTVINSIIITITSMGGYELIADPKAEKGK